MSTGFECKLCPRLIISESVDFAAGVLTITLPAGSYGNAKRYCIVVAQSIPDDTTITAPVEISIGDGTEAYALVDCEGAPVIASSIFSRTKYPVRVTTTATSGVFQLLVKPCCRRQDVLDSLDGTAAA